MKISREARLETKVVGGLFSKAAIRSVYQSWLDKRIKRRVQWQLSQSNIFIVPSKLGFALLGFVALVIILAINYQNNLLFALAFWLFSVLVITIVHSFLNIAGLRITAGHADPVFAGETAYFAAEISAAGRSRSDIKIGSPFEERVLVELDGEQQTIIALPIFAAKRGYLQPERILLQSHAPIGWVRAWCWLAIDRRCLVYPRPISVSFATVSLSGEGEGLQVSRDSDPDDFNGFHSYQDGESLRQADWRSYARGQDLLIREFGKTEGVERWLDWRDFSAAGCETCLGMLCSLVLQLDKAQFAYGLKLPDQRIAIDRGDNHRRACLAALALAEAW